MTDACLVKLHLVKLASLTFAPIQFLYLNVGRSKQGSMLQIRATKTSVVCVILRWKFSRAVHNHVKKFQRKLCSTLIFKQPIIMLKIAKRKIYAKISL